MPRGWASSSLNPVSNDHCAHNQKKRVACSSSRGAPTCGRFPTRAAPRHQLPSHSVSMKHARVPRHVPSSGSERRCTIECLCTRHRYMLKNIQYEHTHGKSIPFLIMPARITTRIHTCAPTQPPHSNTKRVILSGMRRRTHCTIQKKSRSQRVHSKRVHSRGRNKRHERPYTRATKRIMRTGGVEPGRERLKVFRETNEKTPTDPSQ